MASLATKARTKRPDRSKIETFTGEGRAILVMSYWMRTRSLTPSPLGVNTGEFTATLAKSSLLMGTATERFSSIGVPTGWRSESANPDRLKSAALPATAPCPIVVSTERLKARPTKVVPKRSTPLSNSTSKTVPSSSMSGKEMTKRSSCTSSMEMLLLAWGKFASDAPEKSASCTSPPGR